ncbi:acyl-CoA thioesterase [Sulfoacidibacillus thermotolerans]|uniref:Uncharacterized protein n=1 Tax=Sulfoacidibacillus thermotolerans TaxID=1765684 RepID=A0A2U3D9W4_SULT2|nr:thioesterase family protein [Sulfoacidibacillus thermotolerans]PWI58052.1 hypothetical protein BM613_05115 [Sulfoacidibacillus thermotolerans]
MNQMTSRSEIRVRYQETDQMRVAWHGNYIEWFEVARTDWLRTADLSYRELEEQGIMLPVLRVGCEYVQSAHYDELLYVDAALKEYNGLRLTFRYTVWLSGEGKLLAKGETEHVFTDRNLKPIRLARSAPYLHRLLLG